MKIKTIIIVLLIYSVNVRCQESNKLDLEIKAGPMFIGSGDLWIYTNSIKINYSFNKSMSVFLEPAFAFGKNISRNIIIQGQVLPRNSYHSSKKINLGINYLVLKINKLHLDISPHLSIAKMLFVNQSTAYYLPYEQITQEEFKVAYLPPRIRNEYTIGGGLGICPAYQFSKNLSIGVGVTTQLYKNGSIDHSFNVSLKLGL